MRISFASRKNSEAKMNLLSISFLLGRHVMTDEAGIGGYSPQQHGPAYDFWLASIAIAFFATIVRGALERD